MNSVAPVGSSDPELSRRGAGVRKKMSHAEHAEASEKKLMVFEVNPCEPRGLERSGREEKEMSHTERTENTEIKRIFRFEIEKRP